MSEDSSAARQHLADLVLQLGRTAYADCAATGLTQAQWIALRFFSRANRFSRTISGFAAFHATTRGTASQTVKSLEVKGYLQRNRSDRDGRSRRFDLTDSAREKLREDPLEEVAKAASQLTDTQQAQTVSGLRRMLNWFASDDQHEVVGECRLCGHRGRDRNGDLQCQLLRESLEPHELEEICIRFSPAAGAPD